MSQGLKSLILAGILTLGGCENFSRRDAKDINLAKEYSEQGIIAYFNGTDDPENLILDCKKAVEILDIKNPEHLEYFKGVYMGLIAGYSLKGQEDKYKKACEDFMYFVKKDKDSYIFNHSN
jgi:hypothetical protein